MNEMPDIAFLDSHLHLQDPRFNNKREAVLERAARARVARMFCNATRQSDWQHVLALAKDSQAISPFIGIHPWYCATASRDWQQKLTEILKTTLCGIGEVGLDKHCSCDMRIQEDLFVAQLQLAISFNRPLAIHCLGSWGKLLGILDSQAKTAPLPPIMIHSFGGSQEVMQRLVKLGCMISYSAKMAAPGQERLRQVFQQTPLTRVLLETDAPDQLHLDISSYNQDIEMNEPANITVLYAFAANLHHMDLQDFCGQIWQNGTIFTDTALSRR